MKRNLLSCCVLAVLAVIFMSNSGGRGTVSGNAATQAPGESGQTCGSVGCHNGEAFEPTLSFALLDADGNETIEYANDGVYTARITINTTGEPAAYGFQMVALAGADNVDAGLWSDLPEGTQEVSLLDRQYVEQSTRLTENVIEIPWTAPAEGMENITFYMAANAVDGTGSPANDGAAVDSIQISHVLVLSTDDQEALSVNYFPNPTQDALIFENNNEKTYTIYGQRGNVLRQSSFDGNQISLLDLASGIYFVQLGQKGSLHRIVKI